MRRAPLPGYEQPGLPVSMTVDRGIAGSRMRTGKNVVTAGAGR